MQQTDSYSTLSQLITKHGNPVTIGRTGHGKHIELDDKTISRNHAKITRKGSKYYIEDCKSTNGTYLNGKRIPAGKEIEFNHNDTILIRLYVLKLNEPIRDISNEIAIQAHNLSKAYTQKNLFKKENIKGSCTIWT
ncbi:MAG: FHA domain-containing protein [Bacteroidia bacterium]|nr:FHA domain-containing protein [Bacteroidia bacterium]